MFISELLICAVIGLPIATAKQLPLKPKVLCRLEIPTSFPPKSKRGSSATFNINIWKAIEKTSRGSSLGFSIYLGFPFPNAGQTAEMLYRNSFPPFAVPFGQPKETIRASIIQKLESACGLPFEQIFSSNAMVATPFPKKDKPKPTISIEGPPKKYNRNIWSIVSNRFGGSLDRFADYLGYGRANAVRQMLYKNQSPFSASIEYYSYRKDRLRNRLEELSGLTVEEIFSPDAVSNINPKDNKGPKPRGWSSTYRKDGSPSSRFQRR